MTHQLGFTLWLTGLPCAGKTTIGRAITEALQWRGLKSEHLDGDTVRQSLTRDLGFSKTDRDTNIERVAFVAKLLSRNGVGVVASFISPYQATRQFVRHETTNFIEVFIDAPLEVCIQRDVKGLYSKALSGEIPNFTGISDPYEAPESPDIVVKTAESNIEACVDTIMQHLEAKNLITPLPQTLELQR